MVSSSIFKVFGMTRPGIEPRSPGPLANTLTAGPIDILIKNENTEIITDIYHKPIDTQQYLHINSHHHKNE